MQINGKEITNRRCPNCGTVIDRLDAYVAAWDVGHIKKNELEFVSEKVEWNESEDGKDEFYCPHCEYVLTNNIGEAKEFLELPEGDLVRCPHCNEQVIELYFGAVVDIQGVVDNGGRVDMQIIQYNDVRDESDEYSCPHCKKVIVTTMQDAKDFLNGNKIPKPEEKQ